MSRGIQGGSAYPVHITGIDTTDSSGAFLSIVSPSLVGIGGHTQNASISAAVTINRPSGYSPDAILVQATGQNIRYTLDGSAPTASKGFILYVGASVLLIDMSEGQTLRVIQSAATATIEYMWVAYV